MGTHLAPQSPIGCGGAGRERQAGIWVALAFALALALLPIIQIWIKSHPELFFGKIISPTKSRPVRFFSKVLVIDDPDKQKHRIPFIFRVEDFANIKFSSPIEFFQIWSANYTATEHFATNVPNIIKGFAKFNISEKFRNDARCFAVISEGKYDVHFPHRIGRVIAGSYSPGWKINVDSFKENISPFGSLGGFNSLSQNPLLSVHPNQLKKDEVGKEQSKEPHGIVQRFFDDITWSGAYRNRSIALYGFIAGCLGNVFLGNGSNECSYIGFMFYGICIFVVLRLGLAGR